MQGERLRVLLVDDHEDDAVRTRGLLAAAQGCTVDVEWAESVPRDLDALAAGHFDAILLADRVGEHTALDFLARLPADRLVPPVVLLTRVAGPEAELAAVRAGAADSLVKGEVTSRLLERSLRYAVERRRNEWALRRSEEQLRLAQRLEAVGRLAGGIAHDFNNLLTAIQGNTELLLLDAEEGSPAREDLLEIRRATVRAASLTRQLLAFSRKQVLQPRVLGLNDSLREMEKMLCRVIGEDIELRLALEPELRPVMADPGQVEQVFLNLAVNARDAMPRGGRLEMRTRNVTLSADQVERFPYRVEPGQYAEVEVVDTGTGIPADLVPHVFEPFFTTKEPGAGTGLGLSTVYGIVKQSGGYVWVESTEGAGTTFRVLLPHAVDEVEPGATPTPRAGGEETRRATILLVEDELPVRMLVRRVLQRHGYGVLEAPGGEEALALVERMEQPIDLILTDVVMPGMSGRETAKRVQALRPSARALFMSGYSDDTLARRGVLDAGVELIEKPFAPDELVARVRKLLRDAE